MTKDSRLSNKSGVYAIYCFANGKAYVGSSNNVCRRLTSHRYNLRHRKHGNAHLQNAWNLYGEGEFAMGMINPCQNEDKLKVEQIWLDIWMASGMCFNRHPNAESPRGSKWTDDERRRKSNAMKKNPPFKGRKHTDESKALLASQAKERFATPMNNPFFGKTHSEETKAKISAANTGNKYCVGRQVTDKCKAAVAAANKSRVWSKEALEKRNATASANRLLK